MDNNLKKEDNRGVSLVELIIVMAIMGVIIGVTGYGLGLVSKKPVDECARKIEMVLNQNRTNAMGNTEAWVELYLKDGRVTVREHLRNNIRGDENAIEKNKDTVVGADGVKIRLYYRNGASESWVDLGTDHKKIGFKRDSGSLTGDVIYTRIVVYKGADPSAGYIRTIELEELTGKVTLQ